MSQSGNEDPILLPAENPNLDAPTLLPSDSQPPKVETTEPFLNSHNASHPKSFGRYRVVSMLGQGGFGAVYRAVDDQLKRDVAIKITLGSLLDSSLREGFLTEAQIVAALDHPSIVPVYDVGQTEQGDFFVVSKLIDGSDLSTRLKIDRPDRLFSLRIIEQIADALSYAHTKGLVHRDVKPANILLDKSNRPYLTDFGIALRESERRREGDSAGTPAYMSPEQARGEGHRIDNRSDIYSLGVVLYELLSGRRPFRSDNPFDLMMLVATEEVRSPRIFDDTISQDLERICMKALARRASDRFTVARDLADEIRWLMASHVPTPGLRPAIASVPASTTPMSPLTPNTAELAIRVTDATPTGPTRIVPKGLRSFDASDASFFLELLPGPFDREGLPDGLRFWKGRIEETDSEKTFKVGLVYGPSGCGKSSLMKAGLLPRLSPKIIPIYLEATPDDTETRLLRAVRKAIPDAEGGSLKEVLSTIRRRRLVPSGGKLLLVIDQFEQWLFAEKNYAKASLTDALLQCDGGVLQAIVMVREDFWISVSRFLREVDVPILERENSAMVDLFDLDHAAKVLGLFGRAYGKLPDSTKAWNQDQKEFVRQAILGLSHDEKVISVRIALLADMMKQKAWTTSALQAVGGIEGVGVTFLEEMFGSRHAPIQHRQHQEAVRGLLATLLPATGTDIKGAMQNADSLQKAAGYEHKPREFDELLAILDKNLRLITPVDDSSGTEKGTTRSYQLAHDYMVPSLREWLTRKQRETKKGRAELKLAERAAVWNANKENKQLPTLIEWMSIRALTESKKWTAPERSMMRTATRLHAIWWGGLLSTIMLIALGLQQWDSSQRWRNLREQAHTVAELMQSSSGPTVAVNIESLKSLPKSLVVNELQSLLKSANDPSQKLSLAFALAHFGKLDSEYLLSRLVDIQFADTGNLVDALRNDRDQSIQSLIEAAAKCTDKSQWKRKVRLGIAALNLGDTSIAQDLCEFQNRPNPEQRTMFIHELPFWKNDLQVLHDAVSTCENVALQSGICLGIGQMPVETLNEVEKTQWTTLVSRLFLDRADTGTHSAAAWLLRRWGMPEPKSPSLATVIPSRDWFVNSVDGTMLKVRPWSFNVYYPEMRMRNGVYEVQPIFTTATYSLDDLLANDASEFDNPEMRFERAKAYLRAGKLEMSLADLDILLAQAENEEEKNFFKLGELIREKATVWTRMGKMSNAIELIDEFESEMKSQSTIYGSLQYQLERLKLGLTILEPAWRGDFEEALTQLASTASKASGTLPDLYDLAVVATQCTEIASATNKEVAKRFTERAVELLQELDLLGYRDSRSLRGMGWGEKPFGSLKDDERFRAFVFSLDRIDEFWISDREVTRGQFELFMNDKNTPATEKPKNWNPDRKLSATANHPVTDVSWYDAVMFCNWLSQREGRRPCYERTGTTIKPQFGGQETFDEWRLIPGANGYRLPLTKEWRHACVAGTSTAYAIGDDAEKLPDYCQMYPSDSCVETGYKLPNLWGIHDMYGNASEWCDDRPIALGSGDLREFHSSWGRNRSRLGGSWGSRDFKRSLSDSNIGEPTFQFDQSIGHTGSDRSSDCGFRLALRGPDPSSSLPIPEEVNAENFHEEMVRLNPNDPIAYNTRGVKKSTAEDHPGAIADFNEAIRLDAMNAWSHFLRGIEKDYLDDRQGARDDYLLAKQLDPNTDWTRLRAKRRSSQGQHQEAIRDFDELILQNSKDLEAYLGRAREKLLIKDLKGSLEDCNGAVLLDPQKIECYVVRGYVKRQLRDYRGAISDYDEAMRLNPQPFELPNLYVNRGWAKLQLSDLDEAFKDFDEAIRIGDAIWYYTERGRARHQVKDYAGAIKDFDEVIRRFFKDADAYVDRGLSKFLLGQYEDALKDYDNAIRLEPNNAQRYSSRGWVLHEMKEYKRALEDFNQATLLDAKLPNPLVNKSFLLTTANDASFHNAIEGMRLAEQSLSINDKNAYAMNAKSCAYALSGDFENAIAWQKNAMKDEDWLNDENSDGGKHAKDRIAKWEAKELWIHP